MLRRIAGVVNEDVMGKVSVSVNVEKLFVNCFVKCLKKEEAKIRQNCYQGLIAVGSSFQREKNLR